MNRKDRRNLLAGCEQLEDRRLLAVIFSPTDGGDPFKTDIVMVRFQPNASQATINSLVNSIDGTITRSYDGGLAGLKEVTFAPDKQIVSHVNNSVKTLRSHSAVKYAERNIVRSWSGIPNDPRFNQQWGLHNTGQAGGRVDADIDAPEAWDITTGSQNVVIAILDSGTEINHPDLVPNYWRNPGEIAGDGIDNDGNGFIDDVIGYDFEDDDNLPDDTVPHGTHVAGISGARGNNSIGVSGVNQNVSLMILKIGGLAGPSLAGIVAGIDYTSTMRRDHGINIVASNHSYGGVTFSQAERDAIIDNEAAGILFVAAAGNSSSDNDALTVYPAGYQIPSVLTVAATDRRDQLAGFSNFGRTTVDLGAPGVGIMSTTLFSSDPSGYEFLSGTSMASPMVAGAAGLLAAAEPSLNYAQIRSLILQGVDLIPALDGETISGGRLNVNNSLNLLGRSTATGTVYVDKGGDGVINAGIDTPLPNIIVWWDVNKNGALDAGEPQSISDANGRWVLNNLPDRNDGIIIRIAPPPDFQVTVPNNGAGAYFVDFAFNGETRIGLDFGLFGPPGEIHGRKWLDNNGNGVIEPGQGDGPWNGDVNRLMIYVDVDGDGRVGIGEPKAVVDANGFFIIRNVPVGTYFLRESISPGFAASFPSPGFHQFTMTPNAVLTGFDFYNSPAFDFGDAPNSYATTRAKNGPHHGVVPGYGLGSKIDAEVDGQPTPFAGGDDNNFSDDEDGVQFLNVASPGQQFNFNVTVMLPGNTAPGYLNAWMDLDGNGHFNSSEKIIAGQQLGRGTHSFSIRVPWTTPVGRTILRFRYGVEQNVAFVGRAAIGEVEDYSVQVLGARPVANPDQVSVQQFSKNNPIDVLANDIRSINGPIRIVPSSIPATSKLGGKLVLVTNGTSDPSDDFIRYDAAPAPTGTAQTYTDSFQYTITDGTNTSTTTVTITVNKVSTAPIAVDDTLRVNTSGSTTLYAVLRNDIPGTDRGAPYNKVSLFSFDSQVRDEAGGLVGTVTRNTRGTPNDLTDDLLVFTPAAGAAGKTGQFNYTIRNPNVTDPPTGSSATVTLQVRNDNWADGNDIVKLSLEVHKTNSSGRVGAVAPQQLVQGERYWVAIQADDLRQRFAYDDRPGVNANGALSVYLDLLFDRNYVSPVRVSPTTANPGGLKVIYGPRYDDRNTGRSGAVGPAGLINELGITTTEEVVGPENQKVMYVQFVANRVTPGTGNLILWRTDPAEERFTIDGQSAEHDVTVVNRNNTSQLDRLRLTNITYLPSRGFRVVPGTTSSAAAPSTSTTSTSPTSPTPSTSSLSTSSLSTTSTKSTSSTPTAPQQPVQPVSTATTSTSSIDAALAYLFAEEDSPYKKR